MTGPIGLDVGEEFAQYLANLRQTWSTEQNAKQGVPGLNTGIEA